MRYFALLVKLFFCHIIVSDEPHCQLNYLISLAFLREANYSKVPAALQEFSALRTTSSGRTPKPDRATTDPTTPDDIMYEKTLIAGWGDMDFNSHMRNTAFLDKSADVRMMYFADHGFPMSAFMQLKIGPVVMKEEVEYHREFHLLDEVRVRMMLAGLSEDGSRMMLRNDFYKKDVLAARVTSTAGWLDLLNRKLVCPPAALLRALRDADRSEDFRALPNSTR